MSFFLKTLVVCMTFLQKVYFNVLGYVSKRDEKVLPFLVKIYVSFSSDLSRI